MENWQDEIIKAQISQEIGVERSMENSDISIFLKSFKENLIGAVDRDSFDKSWSSDLQSKFPNGSWRTVNGARVFINNGKVIAGLDGFNGEIDKFFDGKGKKESKKPVNERSQKEIREEKQKIANSMPKPINKMTWEEFKPYGVEMQKQSAHSQPDSYYERMAKMEHDWAIKNDKSQYEVSDKQKQSPKKETSKPQLSPDQKKVIDSISKLTAQSKELNKKQVYNPKTFEISKETLKDMVGVSSQIDEKILSRETREKLDEIKEELDNFVTKDIYVQMPSGRKGRYLNRDKDFESDLEGKETLSDKIKFIVDEYDKEDGDRNTEIVGIDEFFPKVKDLLVDIVKEYSNKKTTEILNYKLF